ncbi:MAG: YebC/PmpR family DNA-binding transcriptional regulator [Rickettsiales bacterium]
MAGHSKFKNIMHRKGAQDAKRAKKFTKLIREITTATKLGQPDPEFNPRLRAAITNAKAENLPKDRIDNAIKKAAASQDGDNFEEVRYECYAFGGAALIIDGLTDNRNRTVSDVKTIINKAGASIAEPGSVIFMFDRVGIIIYSKLEIDEEDMLEVAIEAGARECESDDGEHVIYASANDFNDVRTFLEKKFGEPNESRLSWKEKNPVEISDLETAEKILHLIEHLEDNDDVQYVTGNHKFSKELIKKFASNA